MLKPEQQQQLESLMSKLDKEKVESLTREPYFQYFFQVKHAFHTSGEAVRDLGNSVFDREGELTKSSPDFFAAAAATVLSMQEVIFKHGYTVQELEAAELWATIYLTGLSALAPRK